MKQKKRALAALCLIVAIVVCLAPANAAEGDLIMIAFDAKLDWDPKEDTMPFLSGNVLYVYYKHFARLNDIDTAHYNDRLQQVRLFNISKQLTFDLANNQTYDEKGDKYEGVAMWRGGNIFLPARTVRDKFNLYFSYVANAKPLPVAILYSESSERSTDTDFLSKTEFLRVNTIYPKFLAIIEPEPTQPSDPQTPTTQPTTAPLPEPEPSLTYLTFTGAFESGAVLDALDSTGVKGAFFVPAGSIADSGDLLRRAYSAGHTVGLYVEAAGDLVGLLEAANEQMKAVLFTKVRLVCVAGGADAVDEAVRDQIVDAGFRLWDATILPEGENPAVEDIVRDVRNGLYRSTATSVIQLTQGQNAAAAIPDILRYINNNNFSLLTVKEWDTPVNRAGDVR